MPREITARIHGKISLKESLRILNKKKKQPEDTQEESLEQLKQGFLDESNQEALEKF